MMKNAAIAAVMLLIVISQAAFAASRDISSREAKALIDKTPSLFLLDVRTPQEYSQAHLPHSVLIPVDELERRLGEIPKEKPVIIYCAVGARSKVAAKMVSRYSRAEVYNMTDGIVGWYRNNFPLQR